MTALTGGCACGRVRFRAEGPARFAFVCHCRACRQLTGTGHAVQAAHSRDALSVTGAPAAYTRDSDSGHRVTQHFCPDCGSPLYNFMTRGPGMVMISLGALDDAADIVPDRVFHSEQAADWDRVPWHDYTQGADK